MPAVAHRRVLIVDNNSDAADTLRLLLEILGADARVAYSGADALRELAAYEPSLVLLDLAMPNMNGYEVARRIRAGFPDRKITIAALSAWAEEGHRAEARAAGFDHHLVKPAGAEELRSLLEAGPTPEVKTFF